MLDIVNLHRSFGTLTAVNDVSFSVASGEIFGLLGPNGAGKSTTMSIICGLQSAESGSVVLNGHEVTAGSMTVRRMMGVVPQDLAIYPDLTARENLAFFGSLYDLRQSVLKERVDEVLTTVGLSDRRDDLAGQFSGGMKRRLNFAAAILHQPQLLILDEPTVGVDPQSRNHLLGCVRTLNSAGTTVIYVSHYMEEVESLCSRVAIIDHGRILTCDTLESLMSQVPREIELQVPAEFHNQLTSTKPDLVIRIEDGILMLHLSQQPVEQIPITQQLAELMQTLSQHDIPLLSIRTHEPGLERLFLDLTGTQLRD